MFFGTLALLGSAILFNSTQSVQCTGINTNFTEDYGDTTNTADLPYFYFDNAFEGINNQQSGNSATISYYLQYGDTPQDTITLNYLTFRFFNYSDTNTFEINIFQTSTPINMICRISITDSVSDSTQYVTMDYLNSSSDEYSISVGNESDIYISIRYYLYDEYIYNKMTGVSDSQEFSSGYAIGYEQGYDSGRQSGLDEGLDIGRDEGYDNGYDAGYLVGLTDGQQQDEQMTTIFANIFQVAMIPVNFFLAIFNYEIFGINLSSLVSALLTIAVIVILFRTITGGSGGKSDD